MPTHQFPTHIAIIHENDKTFFQHTVLNILKAEKGKETTMWFLTSGHKKQIIYQKSSIRQCREMTFS